MDVVVVGSCMIDLISYVPRLPKSGETLVAKRFQIGFGGKGANQCIVSARLGAKTCMVAKVGNDAFGHDYLKNFKTNNVSTDYVTMTSSASTGTAPIAVDESGENCIIIAPGANLFLTKEDVLNAEDVIKQAKVVVCQFEIETDITLEALKLAKKHQAITIVNPAPAKEEFDEEIYSYADYFCPNETEAELLTKRPVKTIEDAEEAAKLLLERGCQNVIVTLGEKGSIYANKKGDNLYIPARKTKVVDSSGAGDSYIGSLAYYLSCHPTLNMKSILERSGEIATQSVQLPGTQTSYARHDDLPQYLFQNQ